MTIEIHPLATAEDYRAAEQLQRDVWGAEDIEILSHDLLITVCKNGGVVLGAFDMEAGRRLAGFVFGFHGLDAGGRLKLCSHVAGVAREYQNLNIGYRLKLAQREQVLGQGVELITWTFDPLESRNARFNFHKLGATCDTYLRNLYGEMRDTLNAGLPSDRFQVDWRIASPRVEAALRDSRPNRVPSVLQAIDARLLNPGGPAGVVAALAGPRLLIEIPADFQALKARDAGLSRAWRQHTRELFEAAFAAGYVADDLLVEGGRSYYLLEEKQVA